MADELPSPDGIGKPSIAVRGAIGTDDMIPPVPQGGQRARPALVAWASALFHVEARHQIMVLSAVCCLALGGVFVRISQVGPVASGAYRSLIAVPMLFGLARVVSRRAAPGTGEPGRAVRRITRRDSLIIACGGVFLACDLCLWNISFLYTTLAESNLLANLVPFIIAPLCYLLYRDRIPARLAWPASGALAGLYVLVILGTRLNPEHLRGDGLALSTAVFYALFLVVAKGLRERYEAIRIMAWLSIVCGVTCFAVAIVLGEKLLPRNAVGWLILIGLAISSQILGQTLMAHAVKFLPLQLATVFILFQPVAAAAYGWLLFSQRLDGVQLLGIAVLLVAIYWGKNIIEANDEATRTRPARVHRTTERRGLYRRRQAEPGIPATPGDPR